VLDCLNKINDLQKRIYANGGFRLDVATTLGGLLAWRGSAGALRYSIERMNATSKQWQTICDKCATDADEPWIDPHPVLFGAQYRITAFKALAALWLWPTDSPVNASPCISRCTTHDSGPAWFAIPSLHRTLTCYSLPIPRRTSVPKSPFPEGSQVMYEGF
jgi:hypothetical protein